MALDEQDEVREHLEEVNDSGTDLDDRRMQVGYPSSRYDDEKLKIFVISAICESILPPTIRTTTHRLALSTRLPL